MPEDLPAPEKSIKQLESAAESVEGLCHGL